MTLEDWLTPAPLALDFVVLQPRKLFRLGAAFLWRVRGRFSTDCDRDALRTTECYCDGRATFRDLVETWARAEMASGENIWTEDVCPCDHCSGVAGFDVDLELLGAIQFARNPSEFARHCSFRAARLATGRHTVTPQMPEWEAFQNERRAHYPIYLDLIGDPYARAQPSPIDLQRHPDIRWLLSAIGRHETIEPMDLLALADAAEEAGCSEDKVLAHLRQPGPHFRGCWAVERLAGREMIRLCGDDSMFVARKKRVPMGW
jgi:hypothetical protein